MSLITLGVEDVERSTRFYQALSWERSADSVEGVVSFLRGGSSLIGLFGRDALAEDAGGVSLADTPGPTALATNVSSPEVVDSVLSAAADAGGTIVRAGHETEWGGYSGYFADPDGHLWEVAHNPAWDLLQDGRVVLTDDPEHAGEPRDPQALLRDFRARVDADSDRSSDEVADAAVALLEPVVDELAALLGDASNDQVIAAMTLLTDRGIQHPPASRAAALAHAASSLVGSFLTDPIGDGPAD